MRHLTIHCRSPTHLILNTLTLSSADMHDEARSDMNGGSVFVAGSDYGSVEFVTGIGKKATRRGRNSMPLRASRRPMLLSRKKSRWRCSRTPQGSKWAVLEANIDGVDVVAVGYRYNGKKTLFCVMTKGAAPLCHLFSLPSLFSPLLSSPLSVSSPLCSLFFLPPPSLCPLSSLLSPLCPRRLRCHLLRAFFGIIPRFFRRDRRLRGCAVS